MPRLSCLLLASLLSACGLKGDLYEAPTPVDSAAAEEKDKGERKTIPPAPDPALAR